MSGGDQAAKEREKNLVREVSMWNMGGWVVEGVGVGCGNR
jgi:hypothetical protein